METHVELSLENTITSRLKVLQIWTTVQKFNKTQRLRASSIWYSLNHLDCTEHENNR